MSPYSPARCCSGSRWFRWAARSVGWAPLLTPTWGRWDTGQYLSIAKDGYVFERCVGVANRGPEDWCGNSGWFPLYPYMMRVGSWTGLGYDTVGRAISLACDGGGVDGVVVRIPAAATDCGRRARHGDRRSVPVERLLRRDLPRRRRCSPQRFWRWFASIVERWLLAGLCGAVAALVYPSGVLVGALALVPLTALSLGDVRTRVRATLMVGLPTAIAYVGSW